MTNDDGVAGLRIIISGGASGMGESLVGHFARHGAHVVSLDVDDAPGLLIARAAHEAGPGRARYFSCDVSDAESVDNGFARAVDWLDGLDVLVHAAAIAPGAPAEDIRLSDWEKVFSVNARGTFLTNQAAHGFMKESGGRIINFASAAGINGLRNKAHYSATKGAVIAWTRTVAQEWGHLGITVNCVAPAIDTPMYRKTRSLMSTEALAELDATLARQMPVDGRLGDAERDLAPLLRFLAGPGSRFITGQIFAVDGGLTMVR